ncbi:NovQ [Microsporum canis CBS 113480]|uniref:Aromatic prenyltransferase n=1 Tax=Arthroderma otae (strain ATCC MYA-4605 / CBS 113480) TaxID=554155 RepID=PTF_ARTOC|nr:NovQ [Microsporum canis CBS 113480]C5FQT8.1 RecName: Full=Aromatic prenyltransferase [Microsporum canis CBS 113480]EEQ32241.1 NovQ [Microsporum canis CBS 113480]
MPASAPQNSTTFDSARFLDDYKKTADALGAPYNESIVARTLNSFGNCFNEGTVIWRSTSRPNDKLNYRFYLRDRVDTVALAIKAGYIEESHPMARLVTCWSNLFDGETVQWCDLDPEEGVAKTWIFMKTQRSIDNILDAAEVSDCVRAHRATFHSLGLKLVHFAAVDYHGGTLNIYFTVPGPISEAQAAAYTNLSGCKPPTPDEFADLRKYLPTQRFVFAATIDYTTGKIKRVAFYALNVPGSELPETMNDRLRKFFADAPSYDKQQTKNIAWSYGNGDSKYMKGLGEECEESRAGTFGPDVGGCESFLLLLRL